MQKLKSFTIIFIFGIAAFGLAPSPAGAAVVYSYTGNTYTSITNNTPPAGTYDTTMRVTGSFTVAAPLMSLAPFTDISFSVLSYSFSDGRQTLDGGNSLLDLFVLGTDAFAVPTSWAFRVSSPLVSSSPLGAVGRSIFSQNNPPFILDRGDLVECLLMGDFIPQCDSLSGLVDFAEVADAAGNWGIEPAVVPLPPAVLLLGSALVALFGFGRFGMRRRRQV